jgi:hypothetical protein
MNMGNSLHNKIYLGRRNVLMNIKRIKTVVCIAGTLGAAGAALMLMMTMTA